MFTVSSTLIFRHPVYLHGIRIEFVYEGHWFKVKVTAAKKVAPLVVGP